MTQEKISTHYVVALAAALRQHLTIYDLETTTFRGRPNFGITEASLIIVSPEGKVSSVTALVNPEAAIEQRVQELTGITPAMVVNQPTWGVRFAEMFHKMANSECCVIGFNNESFDNRAVQDMNERYGKPIEKFKYSADARLLHLTLSKATSKAGKLFEIAQQYGITPRGNLHRARADTVLTFELLNAIIQKYGVDAVMEAMRSPYAPSKSEVAAVPKPMKPSMEALLEFVHDKVSVSMQMLEDALNAPVTSLSFEVGKAIDERLVPAHIFADDTTQERIHEKLKVLPADVLQQGKLKPIFDAVVSQGTPDVDYIQLRCALLDAGYRWNTLREPY